jgi:hypothetical protein
MTMPAIDALKALVSTPLALSLAGALAALVVVGGVVAWRRADGRLLLPLAGLLLAVLAVVALIDHLALAQQAAERRALNARAAALDRSALSAGSALSCLDAGAGEAVENACEKAVFASPQAAAAAVAYMGARLQLLQDGAAFAKDKSVAAALASGRRAVELDRYGIAAQVLASRDGCTPVHCPAFALVGDADALKANLKAQVFQQYVSRYAAGWNAATAKGPALSQAPAAAPVASAVPATQPVKPGEHWDFPSAASIPPVSIMNVEPPVPKTGAASAQAGTASTQQAGAAPTQQVGASSTQPADGGAANLPLPRKRPSVAAKPPAKPPLSLSGAGN